MKNKTALTGSLVAFGVLITAAAFIAPALARGFGHGPEGFMGMHGDFAMGPGMHMFRMMDELDLTPEQRDQIGALMDKNMPRMRKFSFAMMDDRKALEELVQSGNYDEKQAQEIAARIGTRVTEMIVSGTKCMADMRQILTSEQLQMLDDMRDRHHHRGPRRGGQ